MPEATLGAVKVREIRENGFDTAEIGRCSEMLPSHMQCYRGADYVYSNSVVEAGKPERQVCRYHAKELVEKERMRLQEEQNKTANPEPPKPTEEKVENVSHSSFSKPASK